MPESPTVKGFTDAAWWDAYWEGLPLPSEVHRGDGPVPDAILDVFDRFLPAGGDVLEIGGSPGRYLAYLHRSRRSRPIVLDNSPVGVAAAERNFELLGMSGRAVLGDMFDDDLAIEPVDVVYSLGLIEHFDDSEAVVRAHLRHLKPGGLLLLGAPHLGRVNADLFRRLSPSIFETHDARSADPRSWNAFAGQLGLETLHTAYTGGFAPEQFWRQESDRNVDRLLGTTLKYLGWLLSRPELRALRRLNHRLWSAYSIAVYRKT